MTKTNLSSEQISKIIKNSAVRQEIARKSIRHFFGIYFSRYIANGYPTAPFHESFFTLAEDEKISLAIVLAFRGSAKSTIFSLCYPIWAVTGHLQKKFILIITQTQQQAKKMMDNIRSQLENNELLKYDIGPFEEEGSEWTAMSITLKKYGARIMVASYEQSVRGMTFNQYRPDVVILDDIEDLASVKSLESRNKLYDWFTGDIMGLKDLNTRYFLIGTKLHNDDLPSRLIDEIDVGKRDGKYLTVPIIENNKITWPGKYPDVSSIEAEKRKIGNRIAWEREFMLNLISPEEQLIKPEWITYYDKLPNFDDLSRIVVGIDLAIQQKESSDFTSMVVVYVFGEGSDSQFYVANPVINRRLTLHAMSTTAYQLYISLPKGYPIIFVVEDVGYQLAGLQEIQAKGVPVEGTKVHGQDKYTRASIVSPFFERKRIHFPKFGAKELTNQLTDFPSGRHDDMVDALVYALLKIQEEEIEGDPQMIIASMMPDGNYRISKTSDFDL